MQTWQAPCASAETNGAFLSAENDKKTELLFNLNLTL